MSRRRRWTAEALLDFIDRAAKDGFDIDVDVSKRSPKVSVLLDDGYAVSRGEGATFATAARRALDGLVISEDDVNRYPHLTGLKGRA